MAKATGGLLLVQPQGLVAGYMVFQAGEGVCPQAQAREADKLQLEQQAGIRA